MDAPSSAEVFYGLEEFSPRHQVAAAARVAKVGGGGGGNVPFVGVDPPGSPTDGMLWWDPDDDTPASGGSQPWLVHDFRFTEQPTDGTYTAMLDIAAGMTVAYLAVIFEQSFVTGQFGWGADSAQLTIGDSVNPTGYLDPSNPGFELGTVNNNAGATLFDPVNNPGDAIDGAGFLGVQLQSLYQGPTPLNLIGESGQGIGVVYPTDDTITMTLVASTGFPVAWQSNHGYGANAIVLGAGHAWRNDGESGTSGGSAPDFAGNFGGSVVDNDIVWTDYGAATSGGVTLIRIWTLAGITATDAAFS